MKGDPIVIWRYTKEGKKQFNGNLCSKHKRLGRSKNDCPVCNQERDIKAATHTPRDGLKKETV